MKVLVTGSAGYKGSSLILELLNKGHKVVGVDSLVFGPQSMLPFYSHDNFKFVKADIREYDVMKELVKDVDGVIHLAAIVGFPACHAYPKLADQVNLEATKKLVDMKQDDQFFIYASTCSNYGARGTDKLADEKTELKPLSEYGVTKSQAEAFVLKKPNSVALRVATGFGISFRLRLDLLVNDLTFMALRDKKLKIFESFHRRSFIHTRDIVRAYIFALENFDKMSQQAYNTGDNYLNTTKKKVAEIIADETGCGLEFVDSGKDMDQRDYNIDFTKLRSLGFRCKMSIREGVKELKKILSESMASGVLDAHLASKS
jgi:nucleoside-diphosphate-sugar epimerase